MFSCLADAMPLLPEPISEREADILRLVDTYEDLWYSLDRLLAGPKGLVRRHGGDLDAFVAGFVHWMTTPVPSTQGFSGNGVPYKGTEARFYLALWAIHQTKGGDWNAFNKTLQGQRVNGVLIQRYERLAMFVWRRIKAYGSLSAMGWSWDECRRSIYRGIEGSYRALKGFAFEHSARVAAERVARASGLPWVMSTSETSISGTDGEARLDIVAEIPGRRVVLACKSSTNGTGRHGALYERDVSDSLRKTGVHVDDAALVLGGPGWEGVAQSSTLATVHLASIPMDEEEAIAILVARITDLGLFTKPAPTPCVLMEAA